MIGGLGREVVLVCLLDAIRHIYDLLDAILHVRRSRHARVVVRVLLVAELAFDLFQSRHIYNLSETCPPVKLTGHVTCLHLVQDLRVSQ